MISLLRHVTRGNREAAMPPSIGWRLLFCVFSGSSACLKIANICCSLFKSRNLEQSAPDLLLCFQSCEGFSVKLLLHIL